jgi:hypothetical protein
MNKLKAMLLGFVKPLILAHISDLSMLAPLLSGVLVDKAKLDKTMADPLAMDMVQVIEAELTKLINAL